MADEVKLRGLMGLCVRARQATFGMDGCLAAVRGGKTSVLLVDADASPGTWDKYRAACAHYGVRLLRVPGGLLQQATGRPGVAMAISPGGLADQMCSLLEDETFGQQQIKTEIHCGGASVE